MRLNKGKCISFVSECYALVIMDRIPIPGSICVSREMKSVWTELSSVRKLQRIGTELWWIWLFDNVNKRYLHTTLPLFALYFLEVPVISHRPNAGKTLFTCYYILALTKKRENMQNLCLGHCIWQSMRSPHPWKAGTFFELSPGQIPLQLLYLASNDSDSGLN